MDATSELNKQLFEIYNLNWDSVNYQLNKENADFTAPFLLSIKEEEWLSADLRIMIVGQETKGWWDKKGKVSYPKTVCEAMNRYRISCYEHKDGNKHLFKRHKSGAFAKKYNYFEKMIRKEVQKYGDIKTAFLWNNISKFGRANNRTGVSDKTREIERAYFPVVVDEFKILEPHIVIFMTGPNRDHDIKFHFPKCNFVKCSDYEERKMAIMNGEAFVAIRLYHPSYFGGFTNQYKAVSTSVIFKLIESKLAP